MRSVNVATANQNDLFRHLLVYDEFMFLLGHMGIGIQMVRTITRGLPKKAILLGTLVPDIVDKPLYYIPAWMTGKHGVELGLVSGTRTFGHTALFTLMVTGLAIFRRSPFLAAVVLGITTHLVLDSWGDHLHPEQIFEGVDSALLWPFTGREFPRMPFSGIGEHLSIWNRPFLIYSEVIGAGLLFLNLKKK